MSRYTVQADWDDAPHLTAKQKAEMWETIPPYQRDARSKGIPSLGAGAIYPLPESEFVVDPFMPEPWFRRVFGLDVGWNRTAAIWAMINPETDVTYLYSEHYQARAEPAMQAQAILGRGKWIPGVIDPASRGRSQIDGEQLMTIYAGLGLMLRAADNSVEAGIYDVWMRLAGGKLKVFRNLQNWLAEYRLYRRDEKGHIVKENDHLMDATRYLVRTGLTISAQDPMGMQKIRGAGKPGFTTEWDAYADKPLRVRGEYDPYG